MIFDAAANVTKMISPANESGKYSGPCKATPEGVRHIVELEAGQPLNTVTCLLFMFSASFPVSGQRKCKRLLLLPFSVHNFGFRYRCTI